MKPSMTLRDWFAGQAPVSRDDAIQVLGTYPDLTKDDERASFFALMARLRYEFADAMLEERNEP